MFMPLFIITLPTFGFSLKIQLNNLFVSPKHIIWPQWLGIETLILGLQYAIRLRMFIWNQFTWSSSFILYNLSSIMSKIMTFSDDNINSFGELIIHVYGPMNQKIIISLTVYNIMHGTIQYSNQFMCNGCCKLLCKTLF